MQALEIVGLGYCCIDELLLLSQIPPPEGRALIRRRDRQGGGMVATAMVAAARLGARAGFAGIVGDDDRGRWIVDDFRRYGVDVSRIVVGPRATSHLTFVLVDERTGARSFLSDRGTIREPLPGDLDRDYVTGGSMLHLSDAGPAAREAARWMKAAGKPVAFDGTHFHPDILPLIPFVDDLIVSRFFAAEYAAYRRAADAGTPGDPTGALAGPPTGPPPGDSLPPVAGEALLAIAGELRLLGPATVIVTEGEHGSWCASDEGAFYVPAFPVTPLDTTGAGDVFHGAFLFGRVRGWSLRRSLALASAAAALKCRTLGGRAGIPSIEEALALAGT